MSQSELTWRRAAMVGLTALTLAVMHPTAGASDARLTSAALQAGGSSRDASATVVLDGCLGGFTGLADDPAAAVVAKHGFAGTLLDLTALEVTASPTNVSEGAISRLAATGRFDDGTRGALDEPPVWHVASGPIASIETNGLATAARVYTNSVARVGAACGTITGVVGLLVVNIDTDDFGAYAGDGLDDAWQVTWFGEDNPEAAPGRDPDDDRHDNHHERVAGTDPTAAESHFEFRIERVASRHDQMDLCFAPAFADRVYTVEKCDAVTTAAWLGLAASTHDTNGISCRVRDLVATNGAACYRVRIRYDAP